MTTENPFETAEAWEPFLDRFIREEGNYVFTITEVDDTTSKSSSNPQVFLQLEAPEGTIKDWVTYNSEQLGKVVALFQAAGVGLPKEGEFDPSDNCRLTPKCLRRLEGRKVGGVVRKEASFKDPAKEILRVQGYVEPKRITDDAPVDTRDLPEPGAVSVSASPDEPDLPF